MRKPFRLAETPAFFLIKDAKGVDVASVHKDGTTTDEHMRKRGELIVLALNRMATGRVEGTV